MSDLDAALPETAADPTPTSGLAIAVVGPSGAGKDTLMAAAVAQDPRLRPIRRIITRAANAGGEDFDPVTEEEFARRKAAGEFALSWGAHGLYYAIPASARTVVAEGGIALMNLSRGALAEAAALFPRFLTLYIHARPEILAARLAERGRETPEDIAARIARAGQWTEGLAVPVTTIDNSDGIAPALEQFMTAIRKAQI